MRDVGDVVRGVGEGVAGVGGASFGEGLGDAQLWGDDGVGEGTGVLVDGGVGAVDELGGFRLLGDEGVVDGVEGLDEEVVLKVGVDLGFVGGVEGLGEDREGGVGLISGGGEAGGGEDGFELAGADDGVDFGDVFTDLVAVPLDEAAGDDEFLGAATVGDLVLDHLEDGVDGLLLGGVDEGAGVHDEDVGVFGGRGELGTVVMQEAHHDFGVDEVFGTAKGDEAYFRLAWDGNDNVRDGDGWRGAHSSSV